jgi:hypothetical protein
MHEQLGAASAHQATHAEDFAGANGKGDVMQLGRPATRGGDTEAFHGQQDLTGMRRVPGKKLGDFPAHHCADDVRLVRGRAGERRNGGAVAQHRDAVGDGEHLVEFVGDVDAGDAAAPEFAEQGQQGVHLPLGQRGGRFVENENAGLLAECLGDLDELLAAHAEVADGCVGRDVETHAGEQRARVAPDLVPVDQGPAPWLAAEKEIFRDAQFIHERELLIDDSEATPLGIGDRGKLRVGTLEKQFTLEAAVRIEA